MIAWVVIFSTDSRRPTYRRHLTKIPSPQLLLFRILTNHDSPNLFRIRSYANCRVGSVFSHYGSSNSLRLLTLSAAPQPISSFFSASCALFCTRANFNSFVFNRFRTLCQKPPGVGYPFK